MKINEFKQPKKIDEVSNLAGKMFGDVPMSALKGMLSGKGGKHQLAQDIFLRDFYQDAITSLDNGIKSGYVDPKKPYGTTSTTQPNTQFGNATPQNVGPASGPTGASGTNVTPPNASNALNAPTVPQPGTNVTAKAGTTGTTGSITTGGPSAPATSTTAPKPGAPTTTAPTSTTAAPKPGAPTSTGTPAARPGAPTTTAPTSTTAAPKPGAPTSTGTPAARPGAPTTPTTAARPGSPTALGALPAGKTPPVTPTAKGYNFKTTQPGVPAQPQQTVKVPPQNVKFNAPAAKQDPNDKQYKWAPKGMKITPNTPLSSLGATGKLAESTYHNLNNIFESVISEMNGEGDATTTITDHMLEWFGQYMQGANWESKKAAILPQIKKIQDTYNSDKGKAAIKNLGRLAYAITGQRGGGMPAGAKNAVQNTTSNQPGSDLTPEQLAAALAAQPPEVQQKIQLQVQRLNVK